MATKRETQTASAWDLRASIGDIERLAARVGARFTTDTEKLSHFSADAPAVERRSGRSAGGDKRRG